MRLLRPRPVPCGRTPSITVVIPCYNYGHFLAQATSSALAQPGLLVDVVIVDDASPDGSGEVATALAERDSRITAIRHMRNQGHIATYADGLAAVRGDYCTLVSADDLLTPGSLARAVAVMEHHATVGLVYGRPLSFSGLPPSTPAGRPTSWTLWRGREWIRGRARRATNPIYSPEAVVRSAVQRQVGDYDATLPHTADLEMWLRIASVSDVARVNGPVQALRRLHGKNMSITDYGTEVADLVERAHAFDTFFQRRGSTVGDVERMRRRAVAAVVRQILDQVLVMVERGAPPTSVAEAVEEALRLDPDQTHWAWRELRCVSGQQHRLTSVERIPLRWQREARRRLAWRAWSGAGV